MEIEILSRIKLQLSESINSVLESWGINLIPAKNQKQKAVVRVYLPDRDESRDKRILIGTLSNEVGEFVFRYADSYIANEEASALSAFPDKKKEYRSKRLWPFFEVRIPSVNRQDIKRLMQDKNIDGGNALKLLGELAKRSITTPYELEFVENAA